MKENKNKKVLDIISDKKYKPWYVKGNYSAHHTNGNGFANYRDAEKYCENPAEIKMFIHDSGLVCTHNIPCPVCKTRHAIFILSKGYAEPCDHCQALGWNLVKKEPRKDSIIKKLFRKLLDL